MFIATPLADNPFAVLTLIAAPAVFTNASSVLSLGTGNRLARVVERTRYIAQQLRKEENDQAIRQMYLAHLQRLEKRGEKLVRAMTLFYTAVGSFAAASLVSLLGAILAGTHYRISFEVVAGFGVLGGGVGFVGLASGCTLLVQETRLAIQSLRDESKMSRETFAKPLDKQKP